MIVTFLLLLALFIVSFLLGSIPFGVVVSKTFFKKDLRDEGSGNIGATNALRTLGKKGGAVVFVLDVLKGAIAGALGLFLVPYLLINCFTYDVSAFWYLLTSSRLMSYSMQITEAFPTFCACLAFFACLLGHVFSPWLRFKGGKGVAAGLGAELFALTPLGALADLCVFVIVVLLTRIVSFGSLMAAVALPVIGFAMLWGNWISIIFVCATAILVIWAHRGNIKRLIEGNESRLSFGNKDDKESAKDK